MSGTSIKLKFPMASKLSRARRSRKLATSNDGTDQAVPTAKPVTKLARMLALAHYIERAIERGVIKGNSDAARVLGLSRARLTQVMNLLLLAPEVQARILAGEIATTEHDLRQVVKVADWKTQTEALQTSRADQTKPSGEAAREKTSC